MSFGMGTFLLLLCVFTAVSALNFIRHWRLNKRIKRIKMSLDYRLDYLEGCRDMLNHVMITSKNEYDLGFKDAVEVALDLFRGKEIDVQIRSQFEGRSIRVKYNPSLNEPPASARKSP
jgi:hypothetical protein